MTKVLEHDIQLALQEYLHKWQAFASKHTVFASMKPTAFGWKVSTEEAYKRMYDQLRADCDRTVETWMNGRWIAKMHLKDQPLQSNIELIKLMQRRPGSDDALGIDHVDFLCDDIQAVEDALKSAKDIKWTWETNDVIENYNWISVWFDGAEAKIKQDTVIDIVIKELDEINNKIKH